VVTTSGEKRNLSESQVREIRLKRADSLANGILIGATIGIGAGVGLGTGEACESGKCRTQVALFFGGIGVGAGALLDFAVRKYRTVYVGSAATASRAIRFDPMLNREAAGLRVSLRF
jgi:hypothetical protein